MAASIIRAEDQQPAQVGGTHFGKGDFLRSFDFEHGAIIAPARLQVKPLRLGALTETAH